MDQALQRLTWPDVAYLLPEITLVLAAILITLIDLALPRRVGRSFTGWLSLAGIAISMAFVVWQLLDMNPLGGEGSEVVRLLGDSYRVDGFALIMKLILLGAAGLIVLMSIQAVDKDDAIVDKGETYSILLPALTGAMILCSTADLITMFVGLELLSISTYILVGMRKRSVQSAEGAFKYVVVGGISSAFVLFGMSYLYGTTGSTNFGAIGAMLPQALIEYEALLYVGFFFLIGGLAVKIAAAPFHAWAPDVYQGAASPVAAFLAVISKAAALVALFRLIYNTAIFQTRLTPDQPVHAIGGDVLLALKVLAAAAMIVGTTAALRQRNAKRLLALSGVANAGYLLVPIAVGMTYLHTNTVGEFTYYLIAYALMNIGVFTVLSVVSRAAGHDELRGYAGLYYRAPLTAGAMILLLLSLAGLPITGGFFGKLFILLSAAQAGDYWLAAVMIATSVVSYYFYFAIIRQMFMRVSETDAPLAMPATAGITLWICTLLTFALGVAPSWVMGWLERAVTLGADLFVGLS